MDLDRLDNLQYWKKRAKYLAYRWFRQRYPEASHKRAWKFAGLAWTRFFKKKPAARAELKPTPSELSPDDTWLPV